MPEVPSNELEQGKAIRQFMAEKGCGYRRAAKHFGLEYEHAKRVGTAQRKRDAEAAKAEKSRARARKPTPHQSDRHAIHNISREAFLRMQLDEVADNLTRVQDAAKPSWIAIRDFRRQLVDLRRELDEHLAEIDKSQTEDDPTDDETIAALAQLIVELPVAQVETIAQLAMARIGLTR
jgi:Sec-independent protein translocase protein TatA